MRGIERRKMFRDASDYDALRGGSPASSERTATGWRDERHSYFYQRPVHRPSRPPSRFKLFSALRILTEIGDVTRSVSANSLCSHAGLVPSMPSTPHFFLG